eukprot:CAMPEP_0171297918 /NCGR_PEP_ID=MMETSP0816-20121228/6674_1 /TAXON_ID=420281 /ORGANISM="Proboscia inermis, Strain CCAP1064/1" /LENGTH=68 /DNA_ID=CAMNT_0011772567 /DNA_START=88 /DNA_END=294 /DNA_ORIENTATION=-
MPDTYGEKAFADLSDEVKKAATSLGFSAESWDEDEEPESFECDWAELTPEQQAAALVLGYTAAEWDSE